MIWERVSIGAIAETVTKGTTPTSIGYEFASEGIPFLRVNNIHDGDLDICDVLFIDEQTDKALARSRIKPHDVLISIAGTIGRTAVVPGNVSTMNCNQAVAIIRLRKKAFPNYLSYWLNSNDALKQISGSKVTATISNLSLGCIKNLQIPLPPLEEQRRIAAILDKADAIRRKRKQAIQYTEELLRSAFLEMFGDPVTNPKGWEEKTLGSLCTIVRGGSPRPINDYLGGTIPWIKIGDATEGDEIYIHKTAEAIKPEGVKKSRYLEPGSLIFANCGVSLGFARILKIGGCIHDGWLAFSDLDKSLDQIFLLKLLNSITEHFRAIAPDGTQPNLNTTIMKNFSVPVPPLKLQEKFAAVSHHLTDSIQKNSEIFSESENLFNSLLQHAFKGEL